MRRSKMHFIVLPLKQWEGGERLRLTGAGSRN